jgi:hypothetical protein
MTQHIDCINSKQTDFYGFDILSNRKPKEYEKNNLEMNYKDDTLSQKFKTIFEDE